MSRDQFVYTCLEDYCFASFTSYRCEAACPECGSLDIEIEHTHLDDHDDFSGR